MLFCELIKSPYGLCIQATQNLPHFSWISLKSNEGIVYFILCYAYFYFILTTDKRPAPCHLAKLLAPISSNWGLIGGKLGVNIQVIDDLNKSDDMKLDEVIQKWIKTKPSPTT